MKITFVGTGEACDPNRKNASILVDDTNHLHLLDCGFSSSCGFLQQETGDTLDNIWISHFHGDHFFGIAQLIVHFYQHKRAEPLTILSGTDGSDKIHALVELAYPGLLKKLPFPLNFILLPPGRKVKHDGLIWQSAPTIHSQGSFSLRLEDSNRAIYYSGDGKCTKEGEKLMTGCDLVIHEAFSFKPSHPAHSSIEECLAIAEQLQTSKIALIHINRETWIQLDKQKTPFLSPQNVEIILPNDGDSIIL